MKNEYTEKPISELSTGGLFPSNLKFKCTSPLWWSNAFTAIIRSMPALVRFLPSYLPGNTQVAWGNWWIQCWNPEPCLLLGFCPPAFIPSDNCLPVLVCVYVGGGKVLPVGLVWTVLGSVNWWDHLNEFLHLLERIHSTQICSRKTPRLTSVMITTCRNGVAYADQ